MCDRCRQFDRAVRDYLELQTGRNLIPLYVLVNVPLPSNLRGCTDSERRAPEPNDAHASVTGGVSPASSSVLTDHPKHG